MQPDPGTGSTGQDARVPGPRVHMGRKTHCQVGTQKEEREMSKGFFTQRSETAGESDPRREEQDSVEVTECHHAESQS